MGRLKIAERNQALGMIQAGRSKRVVANHFNCHHSTIVRLCQRFAVTNSVNDRPRTGRQRVTTRNQDRQIRLAHLRDRFKTATSTARETPGRYRQRISGQTVRRRLKESRLTARRPYRGPVLTRRHRTQRLQWARGHLQWNRLRWRGVLFSDESRFHLSRSDGRTRIWRRRGERFASCCVEEVDRFGGGSLMIWAAVSFHYKSRLHFCYSNLTAQRYRDDILIPYVAPMFANHPDLNVFQQDNARPHTAHISQTYLNNAGIQVMPWPSLSPDLASIEHVWDELGRRVKSRAQRPVTLPQLRQALTQEWNGIPQRVIQNIITSMRHRCTACINAGGGHTRY